jgi:hypothetical protein
MERLALIEVLEQDGRLQHAVAVTRWPVTVGRALDCDVVLHDPHVAAHHATLDVPADGARAIVLTVGRTRNGVRLSAPRAAGHAPGRAGLPGRRRLAAGESAVLPEDTVCRIGHSSLRVRLAGEVLAPEQPLRTQSDPGALLLALAGAVALLLWVGGEQWLQNEPGARWDKYLPGMLAWVFGLAVWSALWGLGSKLFQRHFLFLPHLRVVLGITLASIACDALLALGSFALDMPWLSHIRNWVDIGFVAILLARHVIVLLPGREREVARAFAVLFVLTVGVSGAFTWRHQKRVFEELIAATLAPPSLRVAHARPVAALVENLRPLHAALDRRVRADNEEIDGDNADEEED